MFVNPFFCTNLSISDSLKTVRKSVLIYETIRDRRCGSSENENESSNSLVSYKEKVCYTICVW